MLIQNGLVFFPDGLFRQSDILVTEDRIAIVETPGRLSSSDRIDVSGCYVTPGLVDIHIHGCMGADFSDGLSGSMETMSLHLARQGVTSFLGTTMSLPPSQLASIMTTASLLLGRNLSGAALRGINLEGPFFSPEKCGAQNPNYLLAPDFALFRRLYAASLGSIRLVDVAPELPGAMEFIEAARPLCTVSLAHTNATYETALAAFDRGASHVTHLFNAMPPLSHRAPGLVGAAIERAQHVELICDGVHIHPSVIRTMFSLLGPNRICLISDAMRACGMTDGKYTLGGQEVTVSGSRATLADGTIAGSATDLAECMRRAVSFGVPLGQALTAATLTPAKAAGLDGEIGSIAPGKQADLLVLDQSLRPRHVIIGGQLF